MQVQAQRIFSMLNYMFVKVTAISKADFLEKTMLKKNETARIMENRFLLFSGAKCCAKKEE